jgi:diaminopimelate decarboxylase
MENNGSFYYDLKGTLCCGSNSIRDIISSLPKSIQTPFFLYSKKRIVNNFMSYKTAFTNLITQSHGIDTFISYSLKANFNPHLLKIFKDNGSWCSLVNENELKLALKVGFQGSNLIFNGNGKTKSEIKMAIEHNCLLNIDSLFNLEHTIQMAKSLGKMAKIIIRINPSIDAQVHQYLNTSIKTSKFGVNLNQIDSLIEIINENFNFVRLVGYHCHLGSTITSIDVYRQCIECLIDLVNHTKKKFQLNTIEYLNLGGGLGIDYEKYACRTKETPNETQNKILPTPYDLASILAEYLGQLKNIKIIVEPGRSLIADASILVTRLIGTKTNENRNFYVIDASMVECIRPSLYSAYHHIDFIDKQDIDQEIKNMYDIVGPVCESGDFLGKNRYLNKILNEEKFYMVVFDVGAYCASMASNYNMHLRPSEVLVHAELDEIKFEVIRKAETFDDLIKPFYSQN